MIIERGDIVLIHFPFTDAAASKKRPALVLSNIDLNRKYQSFICTMITSESKQGRPEYAIQDWKKAGLAYPSYVRLDRIFSTENRFIYRNLGYLILNETDLIMREIKYFLE